MQTNLFPALSTEKESVLINIADHVDIQGIQRKEITKLNYSFHNSIVGEVLIASSERGIHWLAWVPSWRKGLIDLSEFFPQIEFIENAKYEHIVAAELISGKKPDIKITLSVIGSDFQIQVWQELLKIPFGKTTSYGEIASNLNTPIGRARVIGTAIGKNPIAYLIPCHRVIQLSGKLGGYRWGIDKKREILTFESKF